MKTLLKKIRQKYFFDPLLNTLSSFDDNTHRDRPLNETRFIFQHFPKVAGSTIIDTLTKNNFSNSVFRPSHEWLQSLDPNKYRKLQSFKLICGHLNSHAIDQLYFFPNKKSFVFFRDPIKRVLSNFYYIKSYLWKTVIGYHPESLINFRLIKNQNLLEYLKYPHDHLHTADNVYLKMLSNMSYSRKEPYKEEIDFALSRLDSFDFIGFQDNLENDLKLMSKKFGLKTPQNIKSSNQTKDNHMNEPDYYEEHLPVKEEITPEIKKELERVTKYDYIIYNRAKEIKEASSK